jgi:hypothetical protein
MKFGNELIVGFVIEVVFGGVMFWTGYVLTLVVPLERGKPVLSGRDKNKRKENRRKPRFILTALLGALFGIGVGPTKAGVRAPNWQSAKFQA